MDITIFLLFVALTILFLMYYLVDVNYFIRAVFTIISAKGFRKRIPFLGKSITYGIVLPSDADLLLSHMNNARVLRELDFGRFDHLQRTGMLKIIWRTRAWGVVSAQTCRYRRALHMFMMYKIETQPIYYDTKNIYFEQKVISLRDDIVRSVAHVKLALNMDIDKVVAKYFPDTLKPPLPKDLELWMDYNRVNSEKLKVAKKSIKAEEDDETQKQIINRTEVCDSETDNMLNNS